ncbi:MAG: phage tail tape measure protein, partial [Ruminococcus sp.]|nr:phage tail tape measure protein [Ruminococcus sp.]
MANRIRGITVEINGDTTNLQKSLEGVDKNIRNTQSQQKDVEKLLKLDPTNTELLSQKQRLLGEAVKDTKERLESLKTASEKAAETKDNYDDWKAKYDPIKEKINETSEDLKKLKKQSEDANEQLSNGKISQEEYDNLQNKVKETSDKLKDLKKSAEDVSEEFGHPVSQEQFDAIQREIIETEHELQNLQREAENSRESLVKIGKAGEGLQNIGGKITGAGEALMPVTAGIVGLGTLAVKTGADFDSAMSQVSAVSGATGEDLDALRTKAREMGSVTKFSASEAAEAMNYMAMAGWKSEDMLNGIEGIMNLAAASGEELGTTSDIVTDALTALGYQAQDAGHF